MTFTCRASRLLTSRASAKLVLSAAESGTTPRAGCTARLAASLEEFSCHPAYGLHQLLDLERFVFLLGGSNGERLFGSWPAVWLPLSRFKPLNEAPLTERVGVNCLPTVMRPPARSSVQSR